MREPQPSVSPEHGHGQEQGRRTRRGDPLRLRPDPIRLLVSGSPWRAAGFLLSELIIAPVLCCLVLAVSLGTAALAVTIALIPLLIAAAAVIRGCAAVQRTLLRQVFAKPVLAQYPQPDGPGLWRQARARWTSSATWRDVACLAGLGMPFFALDALVLAIWLCLAAGITLPLWYRQAADVCVGTCGTQHAAGVLIGSFPNGPYGAAAHGYFVHTAGPALVVAAVCAVAFLLFNYVLVGTALLHGRVARAVLRSPADPLAPVKDVLSKPGPLGPLICDQSSQ